MDNNIQNDFDSNFSINSNVPHPSWKMMIDNLYSDVSRLMAEESLLVKLEVREKISDAAAAGQTMAIGGSMLLVGAFAAAATAIIALNLVLPLWASALIVTAFFLIVGLVLTLSGKKRLSVDSLMPTQSIETMGHITNTFKERINEFKSYRHH